MIVFSDSVLNKYVASNSPDGDVSCIILKHNVDYNVLDINVKVDVIYNNIYFADNNDDYKRTFTRL